MARGWGKSEEDLPADKEQAREPSAAAGAPSDAKTIVRRRGIELSLARVREQLAGATHPHRRQALEAARTELERQLAELDHE